MASQEPATKTPPHLQNAMHLHSSVCPTPRGASTILLPSSTKKSRHPGPHPRHKSGTPPVVSPTRTPASSLTHVYRSSAGKTNGGPSRAHGHDGPGPATCAVAAAAAVPQCRGDGQRPELFCSCGRCVSSRIVAFAVSPSASPRRVDLVVKVVEEAENRAVPGPDVVARENACRRGAETAAGARRARSAASEGVRAPSWSGSWKLSSSVVDCRSRVVAVVVAAVAVGTTRHCWFADGVRRYRRTTSRSGGTRKCTRVVPSGASCGSDVVCAGSGYHGFVWTLRLVSVMVVISAGRKRKLLLTTSRSLSACKSAISGGRYSRLLFPVSQNINKHSTTNGE